MDHWNIQQFASLDSVALCLGLRLVLKPNKLWTLARQVGLEKVGCKQLLTAQTEPSMGFSPTVFGMLIVEGVFPNIRTFLELERYCFCYCYWW